MKRLLRVLGVLIIIMLAAIILLPIIFKDEIIARAKTEINNNVNAQVEFADIGLSLFRSFPDFTLTIKDITVDGKDEFEGVRLLSLEKLRLDLDLMSVVSGSEFEIEQILLSDGDLYILVDSSGAANYDISLPAEAVEETTEEEPSSFRLKLKYYAFRNINLVYDDPAGEMLIDIRDLDHSGRGDFTQDIVELGTKSSAAALTFGYDGIDYLSHAAVEMDADITYDQNSGQITFGDNLLTVNDLPLQFSGTMSLPDDKVVMDLSFKSPSEDLKKALSLIPAIYVEGYEDMKAEGTFSLSGFVKGDYDYADHYPAYDINLAMNNGSFKYPDLPASVDGIVVKAHIFNKTALLEGVEVEIPVARARIAGNPVEAKIMLADVMTNPLFDVAVNADLDMGNLSKVVPMTGYNFRGKIKANLAFAGDMAAVEEERYEDLKAEGEIMADSLVLAGDSLPTQIRIEKANAAMSPQYLDVKSFVMVIGKSDFRLIGRLDNLLGYALNDGILSGNFALDADMIDLNELSAMSGDETDETATESDTSALSAFRIPADLDMGFTTSIRQLVYDNLMINDVVGRLKVKEGVASMEQLDLRLLGGRVRMAGSYNSVPQKPEVDFSFDLRNFDIRESYNKFLTIQQLAPIMKNSTGLFSSTLSFKSLLNEDMTPDFESLFASGTLGTKDLSTSPKALQKLSNTLQSPKLAIMRLNDLNIKYTVKEGRVNTEPFKLTSGSLSSTVSGSMGLDQSLDYTMDMSLPLKDIGAANLLNKVGADPNQKVDFKVFISGTATDPQIKTSLKDLAGNIKDQVVEQVTEKVQEVVDDAKDQANAKAAELIAEAEKKGDELIAEAQKQADALVAEAEKQAAAVRDEANKQAKKLEDEAKGNFVKEKTAKVAADKLRSEADKKANQLVSEARNKGNGLVDQARKQKVQLVEEAREKGKIE